MAFLAGFGSALPARIVTNDELAPLLAVEPDWILAQTGIRERRYAAPDDTVASLGAAAAFSCLERTETSPEQLGLILTASGSSDQFCPGPASLIAAELGLTATPALDLPMASAGALAALVLASSLASAHGPVLVVAAEIMSRRIDRTPEGKNTAILFGDGAGAALVSPANGFARIADSTLHTDGNLAQNLAIVNREAGPAIHMDGPVIIRHALRRMPEAMNELLDRQHLHAADIGTFLLHQANSNLLTRIARTMAVPGSRFFANIATRGNTSSASLLIAAAEWHDTHPAPLASPLMLSAFGAGLNWGALLALPA